MRSLVLSYCLGWLLVACVQDRPLPEAEGNPPPIPLQVPDDPFLDVEEEVVSLEVRDADFDHRMAARVRRKPIHYEGFWQAEIHGSHFVPIPGFADSTDGLWCSSGADESLWATIDSEYPFENACREVVVEGELEGPGAYGWMGICEFRLNVVRVVSVKLAVDSGVSCVKAE